MRTWRARSPPFCARKAMPIKTDRRDAEGIARLLHLGWFRPVHCKSVSAQEVWTLLSARRAVQHHVGSHRADHGPKHAPRGTNARPRSTEGPQSGDAETPLWRTMALGRKRLTKTDTLPKSDPIRTLHTQSPTPITLTLFLGRRWQQAHGRCRYSLTHIENNERRGLLLCGCVKRMPKGIDRSPCTHTLIEQDVQDFS